jgi:hypothetical protein
MKQRRAPASTRAANFTRPGPLRGMEGAVLMRHTQVNGPWVVNAKLLTLAAAPSSV